MARSCLRNQRLQRGGRKDQRARDRRRRTGYRSRPSTLSNGRSRALFTQPGRSWLKNRPASPPKRPGVLSQPRSNVGRRTPQGAELIRLSPTETEAQVGEAEANAAQIEARLGLTSGAPLDVNAVPEVQNAQGRVRACGEANSRAFARSSIKRWFPSRNTIRDARRWKRRGSSMRSPRTAQPSNTSPCKRRGRASLLARKALADTVVRAPFTGLVAERLVSVGDYVTRGMKVAVVVRDQSTPRSVDGARAVHLGRRGRAADRLRGGRLSGPPIRWQPSATCRRRCKRTGARSQSKPSSPNPKNELKPGLFATAKIATVEADTGHARTGNRGAGQRGGASRVYIVKGDYVEERVVTVGQSVDQSIEITSGLAVGERVATANVAQLTDGSPITN